MTSKFTNPRLDCHLAVAVVAAWETLVPEIAGWRLHVLLKEASDESLNIFYNYEKIHHQSIMDIGELSYKL